MSTADLLATIDTLPADATLPVAYLRRLIGEDSTAAPPPPLDIDLRVATRRRCARDGRLYRARFVCRRPARRCLQA